VISRSRCIPIWSRSLPPTSSSGTDGSASTGRITSISSCRASPFFARSASASSVLDFARDSRADTAWSNSATTSSSWSTAA
jgi:hypothetical protein